jgi:hypothetical protein
MKKEYETPTIVKMDVLTTTKTGASHPTERTHPNGELQGPTPS